MVRVLIVSASIAGAVGAYWGVPALYASYQQRQQAAWDREWLRAVFCVRNEHLSPPERLECVGRLKELRSRTTDSTGADGRSIAPIMKAREDYETVEKAWWRQENALTVEWMKAVACAGNEKFGLPIRRACLEDMERLERTLQQWESSDVAKRAIQNP
jgi:hypothetical protein